VGEGGPAGEGVRGAGGRSGGGLTRARPGREGGEAGGRRGPGTAAALAAGGRGGAAAPAVGAADDAGLAPELHLVVLLVLLDHAAEVHVVRHVQPLEAHVRLGLQPLERPQVPVVGEVAEDEDEGVAPALLADALLGLAGLGPGLEGLEGAHGGGRGAGRAGVAAGGDAAGGSGSYSRRRSLSLRRASRGSGRAVRWGRGSATAPPRPAAVCARAPRPGTSVPARPSRTPARPRLGPPPEAIPGRRGDMPATRPPAGIDRRLFSRNRRNDSAADTCAAHATPSQGPPRSGRGLPGDARSPAPDMRPSR